MPTGSPVISVPEETSEGPRIQLRSGTPSIQQRRAKNIRLRRIQRKMTQEDLAYNVEINAAYLSRIENGVAMPQSGTLARIARELGCAVSDLEE